MRAIDLEQLASTDPDLAFAIAEVTRNPIMEIRAENHAPFCLHVLVTAGILSPDEEDVHTVATLNPPHVLLATWRGYAS